VKSPETAAAAVLHQSGRHSSSRRNSSQPDRGPHPRQGIRALISEILTPPMPFKAGVPDSQRAFKFIRRRRPVRFLHSRVRQLARARRGGRSPAHRRAVAALLALSTSILVFDRVLATPYLIDAIAPGFSGDKRELTIRSVRILFPGAGLLVLSAWCLGILNSHRRFFISYTAPVIWNAAMIATMWGFGGR